MTSGESQSPFPGRWIRGHNYTIWACPMSGGIWWAWFNNNIVYMWYSDDSDLINKYNYYNNNYIPTTWSYSWGTYAYMTYTGMNDLLNKLLEIMISPTGTITTPNSSPYNIYEGYYFGSPSNGYKYKSIATGTNVGLSISSIGNPTWESVGSNILGSHPIWYR